VRQLHNEQKHLWEDPARSVKLSQSEGKITRLARTFSKTKDVDLKCVKYKASLLSRR